MVISQLVLLSLAVRQTLLQSSRAPFTTPPVASSVVSRRVLKLISICSLKCNSNLNELTVVRCRHVLEARCQQAGDNRREFV